MAQKQNNDWIDVCGTADLVTDAGIAAWTPAGAVAIFFLPDTENQVFVLGHYCPLGEAHVLARGIVGDAGGEPVVASPLYKHHYSLISGQCLEDPAVTVPVFESRIEQDRVLLRASQWLEKQRAA